MKLRIEKGGFRFTLPLPTGLFLSGPAIRLGLRLNRESGISEEAARTLCEEIRRIKKTHGSWELLDFQSADGERIKITL